VVAGARFICQHWIRDAETVFEPSKVSLPSKGDQHYGRITKLTDPIAHGDRVLMARESSEMAVEDQQNRPAPVVRQSPLLVLLVDQVDIRGAIPRLDAHVITSPNRNALDGLR
jgi:hypothetical protein